MNVTDLVVEMAMKIKSLENDKAYYQLKIDGLEKEIKELKENNND